MNANIFGTGKIIPSRNPRQILSRNTNVAWIIYIFWHKGKMHALKTWESCFFFLFCFLLIVHSRLFFFLLIRLRRSWLNRVFHFNYAYNLGEVRRHFVTCKDGHQICMCEPDFLASYSDRTWWKILCSNLFLILCPSTIFEQV